MLSSGFLDTIKSHRPGVPSNFLSSIMILLSAMVACLLPITIKIIDSVHIRPLAHYTNTTEIEISWECCPIYKIYI